MKIKFWKEFLFTRKHTSAGLFLVYLYGVTVATNFDNFFTKPIILTVILLLVILKSMAEVKLKKE